VSVRVLVDSPRSSCRSSANPLLERGCVARAPSPGPQRADHRKLVIADGRVAVAAESGARYYTPFDEVPLTAESLWRECRGSCWCTSQGRLSRPWQRRSGLDRSRRNGLEGDSAHRDLSRARRRASRPSRREHAGRIWSRSGAPSHVYFINGFPPLQFSTLLRAPARGPARTDRTLDADATAIRSKAHWPPREPLPPSCCTAHRPRIVRRRGLPFALRISGWAHDLGVAEPHVHAKASAVDVPLPWAARTWTSLVAWRAAPVAVEDADHAPFRGAIDTRCRFDPGEEDDPAWQQLAKRRAWMRHWPGVLSAWQERSGASPDSTGPCRACARARLQTSTSHFPERWHLVDVNCAADQPPRREARQGLPAR
jgi:hypothetical protein